LTTELLLMMKMNITSHSCRAATVKCDSMKIKIGWNTMFQFQKKQIKIKHQVSCQWHEGSMGNLHCNHSRCHLILESIVEPCQQVQGRMRWRHQQLEQKQQELSNQQLEFDGQIACFPNSVEAKRANAGPKDRPKDCLTTQHALTLVGSYSPQDRPKDCFQNSISSLFLPRRIRVLAKVPKRSRRFSQLPHT
jgi:hypothetical protein